MSRRPPYLLTTSPRAAAVLLGLWTVMGAGRLLTGGHAGGWRWVFFGIMALLATGYAITLVLLLRHPEWRAPSGVRRRFRGADGPGPDADNPDRP